MQMSTKRGRTALFAALAVLAVVPVAASTESPQELFERAETLYRQLEVVDPSGQASSWTRVADAFNDVAVRYPESPLAAEALWRMSWIYGRRARAGDDTAADRQLEIYREMVQRHPSNPHTPEALLRLAVDAEEDGGSRAATLYSRLLQEYPTTPQATLARNRMAELVRSSPVVEAPGTATPATTRADGGAAPDRGEPVRTTPNPVPAAAEREEAGAPGPVDMSDLATLRGIRHYSDQTHTRVVLDLDRTVRYDTGQAHSPERLFIDLQGVESPEELEGAELRGREQVISVGGEVSRVRVGVNRPGIVRVVMDLDDDARFTLFALENKDDEPFRIVIDVPTATVASKVNATRRPPAPEGESISEQLGLGVRRVVIDPGHGGTDPGAIGRTGTTEKDLTLELSRALARRLDAAGYEVLLTRETDTTVSLQERTDFANANNADLFISIHINAARNRNLRGFETYYLNLANDPTAAETAARENAAGAGANMGDLDEMLETIVQNEFQGASSALASSIQDSLVMHVAKNYQNVRDLGVKTAPFFVLVGARMPAVLIEASFVSNEQEEAWLKTDDYRAELAEAIEIGLESYVEKRRAVVTSSR